MVLNQFLPQFFSGRLLRLPVWGLLLTAGLATSSAKPVLASDLERLAPLPAMPAQDVKFVVLSGVPVSNVSMPNGVYLYGQSSTPEQLGKEYLVFEVHSDKIVGALYMPSSEYNCFRGTLDSNQLNLTLVNPEDNTSYSYSIAMQKTTQVAQAGDHLTPPNSVTLEGYHRIDTLNKNDQRILSSCKANSEH